MRILKKRGLKMSLFVFVPLLVLAAVPFEWPYLVTGKGIVLPAGEWALQRTADGNIMSSYKNHKTGAVEHYGLTEFQRGDVAAFKINKQLFELGYVKAGDTVGLVASNEEQRQLIQLTGDLGILNNELLFYTTGQKPEDVETALEELKLAEQELETEKKLLTRSAELHRDSVISDQEFEIAENQLQVKRIRKQIAQARYQSVITGDKPEQALLLEAKIRAVEMQVDQIRERLQAFNFLSPFNGMVVYDRGAEASHTLIRLADTSSFVAILPLKALHMEEIINGQTATIKQGAIQIPGRIIAIDNVSQFVDGRQAFYVTLEFPHHPGLKSGTFAEISIHADDLSLVGLVARKLRSGW
jgi:hypothetical protein